MNVQHVRDFLSEIVSPSTETKERKWLCDIVMQLKKIYISQRTNHKAKTYRDNTILSTNLFIVIYLTFNVQRVY